ncbi:MAG: helix-turn-helix transcriptional regulator [Elusimicrobiales bacterium]|jgi:transcriptional regulator with XRE-family HTH domain|nr:helix-turn-helix transcriptional regulator [Elusimicrobiales bacterium]
MGNFYAEIGGRMRSVRKALRLTQSQVAEKAGIDTSFYGQIERGKNIPSLKTFVAIAEALGADPADLLSGRAGGGKKVYGAVMEQLLTGLDRKKRALVLGLLKDIVSHYRAK